MLLSCNPLEKSRGKSCRGFNREFEGAKGKDSEDMDMEFDISIMFEN